MANGVHVTVATPNFVVVDRLIDGGGPTAQAALSALEGPTAFAAQLYPGELAIAFPGLLRVVGFPLDVPPYPFYVNASSTQPQAKLSQPGYALEATAASGDASVPPSRARPVRTRSSATPSDGPHLAGQEYLPGGSGE